MDEKTVVICSNRPDHPLVVVGPFDTEKEARDFAAHRTQAYRRWTLVPVMTADEYVQPQ